MRHFRFPISDCQLKEKDSRILRFRWLRQCFGSIGNRRLAIGNLLAVMLIAGCADPATKMLPTGWKQLQAGQNEQALTTAQNIMMEAPSSPHAAEVLYLKGRALEARTANSPAEQRRNLDSAAAAYNEALKRNPNKRLEAQIHSGIANAAYWQDDFTTAWRTWVKAYDLDSDPQSRSYTLYRIGLCQQRLAKFEAADDTFAAVVKEYPGTDAANRAKQKMGQRAFSLQVATFASPQGAEGAMNALRREGYQPNKLPNAAGQTVVTVSPFNSYQQAQAAKARLASIFPDALILP